MVRGVGRRPGPAPGGGEPSIDSLSVNPPTATGALPVRCACGLGRQWRIGVAFARSAFLRMVAYRVRYIVGIGNYFLYIAVHYYLLVQVKRSSVTAMPDFTGSADILTYLAVAWAARAGYFNFIDMQIAEQVTSGQLAMELIRPAPFPWIKYAQAAGESVFRAAFVSLPVMLVIAVIYHPQLQAPTSAAAAGLFTFAIFMSFNLYFAINFATGIVAVLTKRIEGFLWAKFLIVQLLAGVLVPLSMFPAWLTPVLKRTPFAGLAHTPVMIYQGKLTGRAAAEAIGWQLGWTVVLFALCHVGWRRAARKVSIQGG